MSRSEQFGGGWGGQYGRRVPLSEFDKLPWKIRRLYLYAAYDYTPEEAVDQFRAGKAVEDIVTTMRQRLQWALRREVLRLYGPEHPQVRA